MKLCLKRNGFMVLMERIPHRPPTSIKTTDHIPPIKIETSLYRKFSTVFSDRFYCNNMFVLCAIQANWI